VRNGGCDIRLGGSEAEYISLTVNGREYSTATDYWDANWLSCKVEIAAGAFRGNVDGMIRTEELENFNGHIRRLYERLDGEAEFSTLEGWLSIRLIGDGRGHIEARC
jgi:hypothetical protein